MAIKIIDPFTNIELTPIATTDQSGDATYLSNLKAVNIGDGGSNVFRADKNGIWLGAKTFASAPFKVSMAGAVTASSIIITGGTLKYGKTSFTDNTHDGYYLGVEGIYAGKAADATLFKFAISDGSLSLSGAITTGVGSNIGATYITGSIVASQIGSVNASAITGTITASQISSVNASAITGSITASQISSVNASAITGSITASQITSITAGQITGTLTASQIASVNASAITGTITAGQIVSITAGQITGQIIASQITNLTITADQIANLTITGGKIAGSTITYDKISVTSLSAISANLGTVTSGTIKTVTLDVNADIEINDGATNVLKLNKNAFIARQNKAFAAESSTAGIYTQLYTAGLNGIMQITNNASGSFGIKDDDSSEYLMKWTYYDTECYRNLLPMVAGIDLGSSGYKWDDVFCNTMKGLYGEIYLDQAGRIQVTNHFDPSGEGAYNLGGSVRYWGDVSYKTLTDRGCLGFFDEGVELTDGRKVSDLEAIKAIQKHPTKKTIYGVPMLDYKTLPKVCYKPAADHDGILLPRDENDNPYLMEKGKKIPAQDGAEMTSLISIMIGSFKELDERLTKLENFHKV